MTLATDFIDEWIPKMKAERVRLRKEIKECTELLVRTEVFLARLRELQAQRDTLRPAYSSVERARDLARKFGGPYPMTPEGRLVFGNVDGSA